MTKIILLDPRLHFISTGRGKMHAADYRNTSLFTMCGRAIPDGTEEQVTRQHSDEGMCGRCLMSLRTYTGRMGTQPKVRFERESPGEA